MKIEIIKKSDSNTTGDGDDDNNDMKITKKVYIQEKKTHRNLHMTEKERKKTLLFQPDKCHCNLLICILFL